MTLLVAWYEVVVSLSVVLVMDPALIEQMRTVVCLSCPHKHQIDIYVILFIFLKCNHWMPFLVPVLMHKKVRILRWYVSFVQTFLLPLEEMARLLSSMGI